MKRFAYLDILRAVSVSLVVYGHYVLVAGYAKDIPLVVGGDVALPILESSRWPLWQFGIWLINTLNTETGALGVTLFFLITGYLMPAMLERYSRQVFIVNRVFRIFPALTVSCIAISFFVPATQNIEFDSGSFLASITLTYLFVGVGPVCGVLWTLVSEVIFYGIVACVGRFTLWRLAAVYAFLWAATVAASFSTARLATITFYETNALFLICSGSAIFLAGREKRLWAKIAIIVSAFLISYAGVQFIAWTGKLAPSSYSHFGNLATSVALVLAFGGLSQFIAGVPRWLERYSEQVYSLYLIHVPFGLITMLEVREHATSNPYAMLAAAIFVALSLSAALHHYVEIPGINLGRRIARSSYFLPPSSLRHRNDRENEVVTPALRSA